jgi:hypothetical protein
LLPVRVRALHRVLVQIELECLPDLVNAGHQGLVSTWHNVSYASKNNGFGGLDARLEFNSPLHVRHFENLGNMAKQGLFVYKGRAGKAGMVERRPWLDALSHLVLLLGIAVVVFPVYVAFIASTHAPQDVMQAPMPLWPGDHLLESYRAALLGAGRTNSNASVTSMLGISLAMTLIITIGKISVSLLSAFAVVFFRFPLRQLCFWTIFMYVFSPL